jgi:hypothetical protein
MCSMGFNLRDRSPWHRLAVLLDYGGEPTILTCFISERRQNPSMPDVCDECRQGRHKKCLNPQFVGALTNPVNMMKMCCDGKELLE